MQFWNAAFSRRDNCGNRFQLLQSPGSLSDQTFPLQANK